MRYFAAVLAVAAVVIASDAASAQATSQVAPEASEKKICKSITIIGSRLAKRRFCGTREEWAERRLHDRQAVEKVQISPCVLQGSTATGRPSC